MYSGLRERNEETYGRGKSGGMQKVGRADKYMRMRLRVLWREIQWLSLG